MMATAQVSSSDLSGVSLKEEGVTLPGADTPREDPSALESGLVGKEKETDNGPTPTPEPEEVRTVRGFKVSLHTLGPLSKKKKN